MTTDTAPLTLSRAVDALSGMYGLLQLFSHRPEIAQHLGDWETNHRAEEARLVMALAEAHGLSARSERREPIHPDNIEVMIDSLLTVVRPDMRAAAEHDLRALVEMAAAPLVPAKATSRTEGETVASRRGDEVAAQRPVDTPVVAAPLSASAEICQVQPLPPQPATVTTATEGPVKYIKIDDGQSTHARTAAEWIELARRDLSARSSRPEPKHGTADEIVAEWKDWIPYPDSPQAEWDRYKLAYALSTRSATAATTSSPSGEQPRGQAASPGGSSRKGGEQGDSTPWDRCEFQIIAWEIDQGQIGISVKHAKGGSAWQSEPNEHVQKLLRDGLRYRWLRSEDTATNPRFYRFWNEFNVKLCREEKMDAAIDGAMDRTSE